MGRIFWLIFLILLALVAGYCLIALRGDNSTNTVVKLLGPGMPPSQCEKRLRPHFEKMEPVMTEIAEALLASNDLFEIGFSYDSNGKPWLAANANEAYRNVTSDEAAFFAPLFQSFGDKAYFSSSHFAQKDGYVVAYTQANCGVPLIEWVRLRVGLGWSAGSEKLSVAQTAYLYEPDGVKDLDPCPDTVGPNPALICQIQLNEKWLWNLEYYDYDQLRLLNGDGQAVPPEG